jgi:hypothetical protein
MIACGGTFTVVELLLCTPFTLAVTLNTPEHPAGEAVALVLRVPVPLTLGMVRLTAQLLLGLDVGLLVPVKEIVSELCAPDTFTVIVAVSPVDMLNELGD